LANIVVKRNEKEQLRKMSLESQKETIYSHQRVAITILDFDWVFEEDNTKKVLEILVNFGENKLFK